MSEDPDIRNSMSNVFQSLRDVSDKLWQLQMDILRVLKIEVFFVQKGWPFILLFFVYGMIFAPLAIIYFIVGLASSERYFTEVRRKEIDEVYNNLQIDKDE